VTIQNEIDQVFIIYLPLFTIILLYNVICGFIVSYSYGLVSDQPKNFKCFEKWKLVREK
jgi:hypothetical protein